MSVKLSYFDGRGLCEPVRLILSYAGVEFEDIRAPLDKMPPTLPAEIKSKCRWGQVPLAEFDGKTLNQSLAITRYFARKYKLIPEDLYQAALCDEFVDSLRELQTSSFSVALLEDQKEKEEKLKTLIENHKTRFLNVFESIIKDNGGKHLVGDSITWADIFMANAMDHFFQIFGIDLTEGYPNIKNVKEGVFNNANIKAWLDKRPKTKF